MTAQGSSIEENRIRQSSQPHRANPAPDPTAFNPRRNKGSYPSPPWRAGPDLAGSQGRGVRTRRQRPGRKTPTRISRRRPRRSPPGALGRTRPSPRGPSRARCDGPSSPAAAHPPPLRPRTLLPCGRAPSSRTTARLPNNDCPPLRRVAAARSGGRRPHGLAGRTEIRGAQAARTHRPHGDPGGAGRTDSRRSAAGVLCAASPRTGCGRCGPLRGRPFCSCGDTECNCCCADGHSPKLGARRAVWAWL